MKHFSYHVAAISVAYRENIAGVKKAVFDERGIEIAIPHLKLYLGEDKDGRAPPLRIRNIDEPGGSEPGGNGLELEGSTDASRAER